jgi:peptide/nickel transport system substrate-binding protein
VKSGIARPEVRSLFAILLTAIGALSGTASAQEPKTPVKGGTLVVGIGADAPSVNPVLSTGIPDRLIGCSIYEGLINYTSDFVARPLLAKSWTVSADGKTYEFQLREAKWQDGKPFTSEDVRYSLAEASPKYNPMFAPASRQIEAVETPAPDKVVIKLKQPFGPLLLSLSCAGGGAILPAHIFKGTDLPSNPASTATPVGTGPFKLVEWQRGNFIRLVRNPGYWDASKPHLDEVAIKILPQASARMQALQAGEVDQIPGQFFPSSNHSLVRVDRRLKLTSSGFPPGTTFTFFNVTRKPFDDAKVRQALFMATNRDYLVKTAWQGDGTPSQRPWTSAIAWAANSDIDYNKMYPFDPKRANALLDEAGLKRGANGKRFSVRFAYAANSVEFGQVGLALQSMWKEIGVDVTVEALELATFMKRIYVDRDFETAIDIYTSAGDPSLGVARTFVTSTIGRTYGNPSGYSNPEVDRLFGKGETETVPEVRGKYYAEAQAILARDLPNMAIRDYRTIDVSTTKLFGAWEILGPISLGDAWLEK